MNREIELKLALLPRHVSQLRHHPLLKGLPSQRRRLLSIYFDTPQFELMQRGAAFRLRRAGQQWHQTLKAEAQSVGALTSRPEWEAPLTTGDRPDFSLLPDAATSLLAGVTLKHIAPLFTTEFQRTTWQIETPTGHAEVALDNGRIIAGELQQSLCEVEIELKSGTPDCLFDIATQLLRDVPLHLEPRSKAERGYLLSGAIGAKPLKSMHPDIHPHHNPSEVWHIFMHHALVQTVANVPGFVEHEPDIEYLHQLRVGLRRLRTGTLLAKSLGQTPPSWDRSLRELMHELNTARDWDVFLGESLPTLAAKLPQFPKQNPWDETALTALSRHANLVHRQAQARLLTSSFTQLVLDIGRALSAPPVPQAKQDVQAWASKILERRWLTLCSLCHNFSQLDPDQRHQARIAAKKMRYNVETFAALYEDKHTKSFLTALAALQDQLGRERDLRIGMQLLRSFPQQNRLFSFELGRIYGALELETTGFSSLSGDIWKHLAKSTLFWRSKKKQ
ncbi:MAG: CYTH and CHAD domain-containing protein [Nitrosomonas sp.]